MMKTSEWICLILSCFMVFFYSTSPVNAAQVAPTTGVIKTLKVVQPKTTPAKMGVQFKTAKGYYLVAVGGGGGQLNGNSKVAQKWETFELIDLNGGVLESGDTIRIRTYDKKHYVAASNGGGSDLLANKTTPGNWETFTILKKQPGPIRYGDSIYLKTYKGQYVVAENGGGKGVKANQSKTGSWTTFVMTSPYIQMMTGAVKTAPQAQPAANPNLPPMGVIMGAAKTTPQTQPAAKPGAAKSELPKFTVITGGVKTTPQQQPATKPGAANPKLPQFTVITGGVKTTPQAQSAANPNLPPVGVIMGAAKTTPQTQPTAKTDIKNPKLAMLPIAKLYVGPGKPICLKTNQGYFVVPEKGGEGLLHADLNVPQEWKTLWMIDINGGELLNGDSIHLMTHDGQHYVIAEGGGGSIIKAEKIKTDPWGTFIIRDQSENKTIVTGDKISLQASKGQYVEVENTGNHRLTANSSSVGLPQIFTIEIGDRYDDVKLSQDQINENKNLAAANKNMAQGLSQRWQKRTRDYMKALEFENLSTIQAKTMEDQVKNLKTKFISMKTDSLSSGFEAELNKNVTFLMEEKQKVSKFQTVDPSQAMKKPVINQIFSVVYPQGVIENQICENSFLIIKGENLGEMPGRMMIRYKEQPEFKEAISHDLDLLPYEGDWSKAWSDTIIITKVPFLPEGIENPLDTENTELIIYRNGAQAFSITGTMRLVRISPSILSVQAAPEYGNTVTQHCAVFGGKLIINGFSFGDKPGKVILDLEDPVKLTKDGDLKKKIELPLSDGKESWKDNRIYVDIPYPIGNIAYQNAKLEVISAASGRMGDRYIPFGPRMVFSQVSGFDYLELAVPEHAKVVDESDFLLVNHDPDCDWAFDSGYKAADFYFGKDSLPANCSLLNVTFTQIPPDGDPATDWALDKIKEIGLTLIDEGPSGLVKFFGKMAIAGLFVGFDYEGGAYYARIYKDYNKNFVSVIWKNTCAYYSPYDEDVVSYMITFLLVGPEKYVPGYEMK